MYYWNVKESPLRNLLVFVNYLYIHEIFNFFTYDFKLGSL